MIDRTVRRALSAFALGVLISAVLVTASAPLLADDPCGEQQGYIDWDPEGDVVVTRWYGVTEICMTAGGAGSSFMGVSVYDTDRWYYDTGENDYDEFGNAQFSAAWTGPGEMIDDVIPVHLGHCRWAEVGEWGTCYNVEESALSLGTYQVTLVLHDTADCVPTRDTDTSPMTWTIHAKQPVPVCPPPGSDDGTCGDGGGGCDGGGCAGGNGGDFPSPSIQEPYVPLAVPSGPLTGPGSGTTTTGEDSCKQAKVEVFDTCGGPYLRVKTRCGCYRFGPYGKPESGTFSIGPESLDDGGKLSGTIDSGGNVSVAVTYPDESEEHYELPPPPDTTYHIERGPSMVRDADGNGMTTTFGETYDTVTTSTGETWRYYHDRAAGDPRTTKIQRTDVANATYLQINYVASGDGEGKPSSIQVKDGTTNNVISETTYEYYANGEIESCTNDDKKRTYAYDAEELTITVTDESTDVTPVVYAVTEYHYGQPGVIEQGEPGEYETWVTRIDPSNSNNNQQTIYEYYNVGTVRTWLKSVTDPYGTKTNYTYSLSHPGRIAQVVVSHNAVPLRRTTYSYDLNGPHDVVTHEYYDGSNWQSAGQEATEYYTNASGNHVSVRTHRDVRGTSVHYDHVAGKPWQVATVKVAPNAPDFVYYDDDYFWDDPVNYPEVQTIKEYEYYEGTDTTSTATLTWDHVLNSPSLTPDNLDDGHVGSGYEDAAGEWTYTELGADYDANASYWNWGSARALAGVDLYLKQEATDYRPKAVKILAKDSGGNYTLPVYTNLNVTWLSTETYDSQSVYSLHIPMAICTTGLMVIYGSIDPANAPHLGEVVIWATSDGMAGQLKTETVPLVDGTNDQVTTYKYSRGSVFYPSPTETIYKDASGTSRTSATYYDSYGRTDKTVDANSRSIWYRYDDRGRPTYTVYKWVSDVVDGTPEVYTQNSYSCCNLLWSQDENGNKTYYAYDDLKRVTKVWTDISGQSETYPLVEYAYDIFGNKHTVTTRSDANTTRVTTYSYDKLNRVTGIQYPGQIVGNEAFGYDVAGNLWWKQDGNGDVTLYQYDDHNRLWNVYYNYTGNLNPPSYQGLTADVTYGYREVNQWSGYAEETHSSLKTSMTGSSGISRYHYDFQGRLVRYVPPTEDGVDYVVAYSYNKLGEKTSIQIGTPDPNDPNYYTFYPDLYYAYIPLTDLVYDVSYEYHPNGWLKNVKNGANTVAEYTYDIVGNRTDTDYGNSTHIDYAFDTDPRYRTTSITHKYGANVLAEIGYPSRDEAGNPGSMSDWTGTWSYDYDSNNRLVGATPPVPVPGQPAGGPYGYDWVGNRLNPPAGSNPMVYNNADQLIKWPGTHGDATHDGYVYDDAGNLTEVKDASGTNSVAGYSYTPAGLLDTAVFKDKVGSTVMLTNTWDADSNRVWFRADVTEYSLVYDPTAGIPAVLEESIDGGSATYYIREPGGALIARLNTTDGTRYYHFDELGSTRLLTDSTGTVTDNYTYDAYGSVLSHDACTGSISQPYQYVGQLGYYTHYMEPDFGLLQLGVRFYDPEVGRFTQRDPMDPASKYVYCRNAPIVFSDPTGLRMAPDDMNYQLCVAMDGTLGHDSGPVVTETHHSIGKFLKCLGAKNALKAAVCAGICGWAAAYGEPFLACMTSCMTFGLGDTDVQDVIDCWDNSAYDIRVRYVTYWCEICGFRYVGPTRAERVK